jgi:hypothetical protein
MTGMQYLIIAYAIGFGLLLGYAAKVWIDRINLGRADHDDPD